MINLKFSRNDENDADLVGLDIAARGGYDPRSAITLWLKMQKLTKLCSRMVINTSFRKKPNKRNKKQPKNSNATLQKFKRKYCD